MTGDWQSLVTNSRGYSDAIAQKPKLPKELIVNFMKIQIVLIAFYVIVELSLSILSGADEIIRYVILAVLAFAFILVLLNTLIIVLSPVQAKAVRIIHTRISSASNIVFYAEVEHLDGTKMEHRVYGDNVAASLIEGSYGVAYFRAKRMFGFKLLGYNSGGFRFV